VKPLSHANNVKEGRLDAENQKEAKNNFVSNSHKLLLEVSLSQFPFGRIDLIVLNTVFKLVSFFLFFFTLIQQILGSIYDAEQLMKPKRHLAEKKFSFESPTMIFSMVC
jgi:hypothetical protein